MPRMTIFRSSTLTAFALVVSAAATAQGARASSHTVKAGDTLWNLARTYLGDPFLWPQIYKLNTDVVEDPHWIYPGEVLKLVAVAGQTAVPTQDTPPPTAPAAAMPAPPPPPAPLAMEQGQQAASDTAGMELFRRKRVVNVGNAFKTYREAKYYPLRPGEFYSGGFLTEGTAFPFGTLLGPVTPEQIESSRARTALQIHSEVAVLPPGGASYAANDTLVIVDRREGPVGYGEIIVPTGMVRVTGRNGSQAVGMVVAVYGPIRDGQSVLPAEKFADPGAVAYVKVNNGLEGRVLIARDLRELRLPQHVLFLDVGKSNGVALGDMFEARRDPGPQRRAAADAVDEVMATLQVIHVRDRTATVKVLNVISPDVPPGTRVKLVAKLPS